MNRFLLILTPALALGACAGKTDGRPRVAQAEPAPLAQAQLMPADALPVPTATPRMPLSPEAIELLPAPAEASPGPPLARVEQANRSATREPDGRAYVNARQVYAWSDGALYRLYTAPERVSEIVLEAGETLVSVAAGDTSRWVIGDTSSGAGAERRTHVLVKPTTSGLRTNLLIATDRRVYHIWLESTPGAAMASIAWSYPADALLALTRTAKAAADTPVNGAIAGLEALNFAYAIEGDEPPWRPLRAFDDGQQVFIEFPRTLGQGEAPPLFVRGEGGGSELVNYRVSGRFYVVDRLFAEAELRLGERRQRVVRIVRSGAGGTRHGRER